MRKIYLLILLDVNISEDARWLQVIHGKVVMIELEDSISWLLPLADVDELCAH